MVAWFLWAVSCAAWERPVALTPRLDVTVDSTTAHSYHFLPGVRELHWFRIVETHDGFRVVWAAGPQGGRTRRVGISARVLDASRRHALLVERLRYEPDLPCLTRCILTLASRGQYHAAGLLADAAGEGEPGLDELRREVWYLSGVQGLWAPTGLYDHSGRGDLLVFSGYYGLWLGIALPVAARASTAAEYGVPLLVVPPASIGLTAWLTRRAQVSDGRAGMITLGAHWGTWQGLGWAVVRGNPGHRVVRDGIWAGLAGLGAAVLLTSGREVTPGHAELAHAALPWGAWAGAVVGANAGDRNEDLIRDMLVGSSATTAAALWLGKGSSVSRARVRICQVGGLVGAICGMGVHLLLDAHDGEGRLTAMGLGSLAGLGVAIHLTGRAERSASRGVHGGMDPGNGPGQGGGTPVGTVPAFPPG